MEGVSLWSQPWVSLEILSGGSRNLRQIASSDVRRKTNQSRAFRYLRELLSGAGPRRRFRVWDLTFTQLCSTHEEQRRKACLRQAGRSYIKKDEIYFWTRRRAS